MMRFRLAETARIALGFALGLLVISIPWTVRPSATVILADLGIATLPLLCWLAMAIVSRRGTGFRMPARWLKWLMATALFVALVGNVACFGGSLNWLRIGLIYGAEKFPDLEAGGSVSLAGILARDYGWHADELVMPLQQFSPGITISHVLIALYAVGVLLIAWCLARTEKHGRRGFVLAMAAPWILYFAVFPKMHERYLLWGALAACAGVAVNVGSLWLAIFFSACSTAMSLRQMADGARRVGWHLDRNGLPFRLGDYLNPIYPGLGWAVVLATAVWLWMTVAPALAAPRRRPGGRSVLLPTGDP
jgi:hypothetical protein